MKLSQLLKDVKILKKEENFDPEISSVHYDSRLVKPGGLFVTLKGVKKDGADFIKDAFDRGAKAVVSEAKGNDKRIVTADEDVRKSLAKIGAEFYGHPSKKLCLIGITGTNGKTTTSLLIESIFKAAGYKTGVIGTISCRYADKVFESSMTTPQSLDLQRIFFDMLKHNITHAVMEVSSHAVAQHRAYYTFFDAGVFTNITQDHLDFHKTMEAYWECKKSFFTDILGRSEKKSTGVINIDDQKGKELFDELLINKISTGRKKGANVKLSNIKKGLSGIEGRVASFAGDFDFRSPLIGDFNVENILCAVGAALTLPLSLEVIKKGIESLKKIDGRLEKVENSAGINIYVDYAHTPDALENVLKTLRPLTSGKIICVFGCGGDRDKGKRPKMGMAAGRLSDFCIITSDNPRTEDKDEIIKDIIKGMQEESSYIVEPDRQKAIETALKMCGTSDVVIIAGKGHETYQIIGDTKIDFDDRQIARQIIKHL